MYRKLAALTFSLIAACAIALPVFANDSDTAFEVVEPAFGSNNEVVTKNLLINISIYREIPLEMTLVRIEPNIRDAVVRDKITSLEDSSVYSMPLLPSEEIIEELVKDIEAPFEIQETYEEEKRREIAASYLEALEAKQSAEEEFIRVYDRYEELFYSEDEEKIVMPKSPSFYEKEVIGEYEAALKNVIIVRHEYELILPVYRSIYETIVLGPEKVEKEGVLPFYKTVVEEIKPGDYKLIFKSDDEIIDIKEFKIKEPKEFNEEEIKVEMTNIRKNFLNDTTDK